MLPLNTTVALDINSGAPGSNRTNALPGFNGTLYLLSYRSTSNNWYRRVDSNHHELGFEPSMSASCITPA